MIITTFAALIYQGYNHFFGAKPNFILGITSLVLLILAVVVAGEAKKILSISADENSNITV
jgi:carbon starvation protein